MKNSKRNLRNAVAKAERLAAGKPSLSRYERKHRLDLPRSEPAPSGRGVELGEPSE